MRYFVSLSISFCVVLHAESVGEGYPAAGWEFGPAPESGWVVRSTDWENPPMPRAGDYWRFERVGEGRIDWVGLSRDGAIWVGELEDAEPVLWVPAGAGVPAEADEVAVEWAASLEAGVLLRITLVGPSTTQEDAESPGARESVRRRNATADNEAALEESRRLRPSRTEQQRGARPRRQMSREEAEAIGFQIFGRS